MTDGPRLSPRQREVARLVGEGLTYKCIGARLGLTARTVETYVRAIARRLPPNNLAARQRVQTWAARAEAPERRSA